MRIFVLLAFLTTLPLTLAYGMDCAAGEVVVDALLLAYNQTEDDVYVAALRPICHEHYEYRGDNVALGCRTGCPGLYLGCGYTCAHFSRLCLEYQQAWLLAGCHKKHLGWACGNIMG